MSVHHRHSLHERFSFYSAMKHCRKHLLGISVLGCLIAMGTPVLVSATDTPISAQQQDAAQREANQQTVLGFYKGFANYDFEECRKYLGPYYLQHKAHSEEIMGRELKELEKVLNNIRQKTPGAHLKVDYRGMFTLADPNYVVMAVHTAMVMGEAVAAPAPDNSAATRPREMVHIFRLEQGKIVEHWDITATSP